MKLVNDFEGEEYIDTELTDLDGEKIIVSNADGFGACNVTVGTYTMRWDDFDELRKAMDKAEYMWRGV